MKSMKSMNKDIVFYGSATIGERGQIVVPIKARQQLNLKPGDKMLFLGTKHSSGLLMIKSDMLNKIINKMVKNFEKLKSKVGIK